jgi:hypothetical protein
MTWNKLADIINNMSHEQRSDTVTVLDHASEFLGVYDIVQSSELIDEYQGVIDDDSFVLILNGHKDYKKENNGTIESAIR